VNFLVLLFNCTGATAKTCRVIQFDAVWDNSANLTLEDVNECNGRRVFGRMVLSPNRIVVSHATPMEGATDHFFEVQLKVWDGVLGATLQCFAEKKHIAPGAKPGPSAAVSPKLPLEFENPYPSSMVASSLIPPADVNVMPQ
jgi:hypothetical protein